MSWRLLTDTAEQEAFLAVAPWSSGLFLQSPSWGKFLLSNGQKVTSYGWYEGGVLRGVAQCSVARLLGARYLLCAKGPVWAAGVPRGEAIASLVALREMLRGEQLLFVRLEPVLSGGGLAATRFTCSADVNPRATCVVDLTLPEPVRLQRFHQKTRYNLRLAERSGLTFHWGGPDDFGTFWSLLQETAVRERFRPHPAAHYQRMLNVSGQVSVRLGLVSRGGAVLAASLVVVGYGTGTYLHGASSRTRRELMAPYLLHGGAMAALQAEGGRAYDLWGIQPDDGSHAAWAGFTRFKLGFGGDVVTYTGTWDYPYANLPYRVYLLARALRRAVRL